MLLTNISHIFRFETITGYVIISKFFVLEEHFSTLAITVGLTASGPGIFIRFNHGTVIAYPCPLLRAFSQANKIFNTRVPFRFKFLLQKIQFLFILNRNKLAIVQRAQMQAFNPSCCLLCRWFMNSVTRTTGFKCLTLNEIKHSVSKHLRLFYIHSLHCSVAVY